MSDSILLPELQKLQWITGGFHNPECAVYDPRKAEIYLSCMASDYETKPLGRGYVSRLTPAGEILQKHWITGLKNPCGLAVRGGRLYIVDCDRLLVADAGSGAILEEYLAPGAEFLDGMGVNEDGSLVFVSDIWGNAIWRLAGDKWEKWLEDPRLNQPDGMVASAKCLTVGGFSLTRAVAGTFSEKPAEKKGKGHIIQIDYDTKSITDLGDGTPIAHHDGLCTDGGSGYFTSDFIEGTVLHVSRTGKTRELIRLDHFDNPYPPLPDGQPLPLSCGPADIQYVPELRLLLIPLLTVGKLAAYTVAS